MNHRLATILLCTALMVLALLLLSLKSRPKSRALRIFSRILFSALALCMLHRLYEPLPALNAFSLSLVSGLGTVGYALACLLIHL